VIPAAAVSTKSARGAVEIKDARQDKFDVLHSAHKGLSISLLFVPPARVDLAPSVVGQSRERRHPGGGPACPTL